LHLATKVEEVLDAVTAEVEVPNSVAAEEVLHAVTTEVEVPDREAEEAVAAEVDVVHVVEVRLEGKK